MDACPDPESWNSEEIRVSLAVDFPLTVDQPPLAVGVRFPLCPPSFSSMTTGPFGAPSPVLFTETKRRPTARKAVDHHSGALRPTADHFVPDEISSNAGAALMRGIRPDHLNRRRRREPRGTACPPTG